MEVLVTGATGFIGRHVVSCLLEHQHSVSILVRDLEKASSFQWFDDVNCFVYDIQNPSMELPIQVKTIDVVLHLAWSGLPNYKELFHFEDNVRMDYLFLKRLVQAGLKHFVVTGTCFEYGMYEGLLSEELMTDPKNAYGFAKDTLRKSLFFLSKEFSITVKWARLFYMYGEGQNPRSLLAQLDSALESSATQFNMSGGEQIRDYLPVEKVAFYIVKLMEHSTFEGIVNICSGKPISIRKLVEQHLDKRKAQIQLNLGYYPYPQHEPMAFWGDNTRIQNIAGAE